jgi:FlaA1/EpsC-like NDP-sugar epimerase
VPVSEFRVLIIGHSKTLPAAIAYLQSASSVEIIGLLGEESGLEAIAGVPVLGKVANLVSVLATQSADLVLLAGSELDDMAQILKEADRFGIPVRILPSPDDLLSDRVRVTRSLSQGEIDRQLDRNNIELSNQPHPSVLEAFCDRTVLITGAGGSIGSELARQAAHLHLSRLVLLDHDENSLVERTTSLRNAGLPLEIVPIIGDVRDVELLRHTFRRFAPHIVLHAAAYKHVPVLEDNCCEAVLNNVSGTRELAHAALDSGVERFVLISTDKAVHPSSVMGASKRVAELVVQQQAALAAQMSRPTRFACVRFVNVLGSRGSVVPIFLKQIAAGGPLTITHEEMSRYFMTIPQASQLVLQASTLASDGDIYMLEMGDPMRILDFARELIRMSGLRPDLDVAIELIGIRPGEKLHEQLARHHEHLIATGFPYVFRTAGGPVPTGFAGQLALLETAAQSRQTRRLLDLLSAFPIDYAGISALSPDGFSS